MKLEEKVKALAKEAGFDLCGITSAAPFDELKEILKERFDKGYHSEFEELDLDKRLNPRLVAPQANSIIALAKAYGSKPVSPKPAVYGRIARFALGEDYHLYFQRNMEQFSSLLKKELGLTPLKSMVDTGPLLDRAVALRAGLGWQGKNCSIINASFGSWIVLGQILIKEKLKADPPLEENCGSCDKCLKACPTGALTEAYRLNSNICLSYLTQTKSIIPKKYRTMLGNRIYGCDTCQEVCPHNKLQLSKGQENEEINLLDLLKMSNSKFHKAYAGKAFAWRGKSILQRNAIIALGNLRDKRATGDLIRILNGANPMLRGYSAWALGKISSKEAIEALEKALEQEQDSWVKKEIMDALN